MTTLPKPRSGWRVGALCRKAEDPDLWFPPGTRGTEFAAQAAVAAAICHQKCPVRVDCLRAEMRVEEGKSEKERHGVRGGLTGAQRARLEDEWNRSRGVAA